jgi:hypothetical protein
LLFFDRTSIGWGDNNWVVALERGIQEAENIVAVLSPSYCESEWGKLERTAANRRFSVDQFTCRLPAHSNLPPDRVETRHRRQQLVLSGSNSVEAELTGL